MGSSFKRNRIINGNMLIDQRNAGASVSISTSFPVDRFFIYAAQASKFTAQQNAGAVTPPSGFSKYLGATSSSAYSITATDQFFIAQAIEGFNFADMAWGTASAQTVTLSFRVYSSLTGTFGGSFQNAAQNRCYPFSYSVPVAYSWTTINITVPGDTAGTWVGATNAVGVYVNFSLGTGATYSATAGSWTGTSYITSATGAVSVVGTSGATFYITGVQLEVGTKATPYEMQIYSDQLAQCQRYYYKSSENQYMPYAALGGGSGGVGTSFLPVVMRTTGTFAVTAGGNGSSFGVVASGVQYFAWSCTGSGAGNSYISGYTASAEL